jgi:DNA-binding GntR family transcriptional regulator
MPSDAAAKRRRTPRRSLADEIRDLIARELILSGAVRPGELLPSEAELAVRYDASRVTVRASLRSLQEAHFVVNRHGVGTVVLERPIALRQGLDRLASLERFARDVGVTLHPSDVEWDRIPADEQIAEQLEIAVGDPVVAVRRARCLDDAPVAWTVDHVPAALLPAKALRRGFTGSIVDVLLDHPEIGVEYADTEMMAVNLSSELAARLHVKTGTAAQYMELRVCDAHDRPVDFVMAWMLPEHFRFVIRRRREIG